MPKFNRTSGGVVFVRTTLYPVASGNPGAPGPLQRLRFEPGENGNTIRVFNPAGTEIFSFIGSSAPDPQTVLDPWDGPATASRFFDEVDENDQVIARDVAWEFAGLLVAAAADDIATIDQITDYVLVYSNGQQRTVRGRFGSE